MCEASSADRQLPLSDDEQARLLHAHKRQKAIAVGAVTVFVIAVVITVLASWPGSCERAAKRICDAAWAEDCSELRALIETIADEDKCAEQLDALAEIDASPAAKVTRSFHYATVIKTLIGEARYAELEAAAKTRP